MKLKRISFKPHASLELSEAEVTLLAKCAAVHYDGVCKDTIQPGGIIFGIQNWSKTCPGRPHDLKWREIDTLAKVLEVGTYAFGADAHEGREAMALNVALRQVLHQLNDETPEPKTY